MLLDNRIALWDVLGYCEREGSLDSDITCEQPNDLAGFLQNHPQIHTICCNGGKAAATFKKIYQTARSAEDYCAFPAFYQPGQCPLEPD